jgi:hypothetical protein
VKATFGATVIVVSAADGRRMNDGVDLNDESDRVADEEDEDDADKKLSRSFARSLLQFFGIRRRRGQQFDCRCFDDGDLAVADLEINRTICYLRSKNIIV